MADKKKENLDLKLASIAKKAFGLQWVGDTLMMPCWKIGQSSNEIWNTCYECNEALHCKHCCNGTMLVPVVYDNKPKKKTRR